MAKIDWEQITDLERYPALKMNVGEEHAIVFEDEGNFVSKKQLQDKDAPYPQDRYIFVVSVEGEKKEFWISVQNYSLMRQLKRIKETHSNSLKGIEATIKRISDSRKENNYEIKERAQ